MTGLFLLFIFSTASALALWASNELYYRAMGRNRKKWLLVTGLAGSPVHQLSHAAMAAVLGMKVDKIAPYSLDPESQGVGFVSYRFRRSSIFQRTGIVLVGLAPLIVGAYVVHGLLVFNDLPTLHALRWSNGWSEGIPWGDLKRWASAALANISGWGTAIALLLCTMIGAHSSPSWADIARAGPGLIVLLIIGGIFCLIPLQAPLFSTLIGGYYDFIAHSVLGGLGHFMLTLAQMCLLSVGATPVIGLLVAGVKALVGLISSRQGQQGSLPSTDTQ